MKQKKASWIFVFLFAIGVTGMRGQTSLQVKDISGTQTSYVLSSIRKLTFATGNMTVSGTDGSTHNFALANVRNMNFSNLTSVAEVDKDADGSLTIYPNPVKDLLRIHYVSTSVENVQLQLLDIQGRIIYQQQLKALQGINPVEIPVGTFQNGLYLCRVVGENKSEIRKFIKFFHISKTEAMHWLFLFSWVTWQKIDI